MGNFRNFKLDTSLLNNTRSLNLASDISNRMQREQEETMRQMQRSREEAEKEKLRRHNELVSAIKSAADSGATIIIGDNASDIQIQQNTVNSSQTSNLQSFDYEKVINVLKEIKGYFEYPQFNTTFGENSDIVKQVIEDTVRAAEKKEEPTLIKKSLQVLKELAIGVSGSLIASGILASLAPLLK